MLRIRVRCCQAAHTIFQQSLAGACASRAGALPVNSNPRSYARPLQRYVGRRLPCRTDQRLHGNNVSRRMPRRTGIDMAVHSGLTMICSRLWRTPVPRVRRMSCRNPRPASITRKNRARQVSKLIKTALMGSMTRPFWLSAAPQWSTCVSICNGSIRRSSNLRLCATTALSQAGSLKL